MIILPVILMGIGIVLIVSVLLDSWQNAFQYFQQNM